MSFSTTAAPAGGTQNSPMLEVTEFGSIKAEEALPATLEPALFGGDSHTYFVFDAARAPGLSEWLGGTGLKFECLFQGEASDTLAEVAPWIVQLTPDATLLRALFQEGEPLMMQLWGAKAGIFLRSAAPMKAVSNHLRRMTRVRNANDAWTYFRFWDPVVAFDYFAKIVDWPERVESVFTSRHLNDLELLAVHEKHGQARHFKLSAGTPAPRGAQVFKLTQRDHDIFEARQMPILKEELSDWLVRADPKRFRPFTKAQRDAIAEHGLKEGARFGFTFKEEYAHLLYMMSFLGGWFHTSPDFAPFLEGWTEPAPKRYEAMRLGFVKAHATAYPNPDLRAQTLEAIYNRASFIPGGVQKAGPADIETLTQLAEQLLPHGTSPKAARAETTQTCASLKIADRRVKCLFHVMRLVLGPQPLDDPFQPWIRDKLFASGQRPSNVAKTAEFSLRRLRHLV